MNHHSIAKASRVVIDGVEWVPFIELEEGVVMRPWGSTRYQLFGWSALTNLWFMQRMRIRHDRAPEEGDGPHDETCFGFAAVDPSDREVALRRLRYVEAVDRRAGVGRKGMRHVHRVKLSAPLLGEVAAEVAKMSEPEGLAGAPYGRTLREWYERYLAAGRCPTALLPRRNSRSRKRTVILH